MDCSKTENYFKEKARMTKSDGQGNCRIFCSSCPLSKRNNDLFVNCMTLESSYPQKAVEIVQNWSDEHPQKTMLQDFLSKYPKAPFRANSPTPKLCPHNLGYSKYNGCDESCEKCWNRPIEEG